MGNSSITSDIGLEEIQKIASTPLCLAYGRSGIGGRDENQDSYSGTNVGEGVILTVCDGMGGMNGGQTASCIARNEIVQTFMDVPLEQWDADLLRRAVNSANAAVYRRALNDPPLRGMGTTATVLALTPDAAYLTHVGDSRIYQIRRKRKYFRTFDHSRVFEMVSRNMMTEEQARQSSFSNIITRALGIKPDVDMTVEKIPYKKGDRFILCSDGIWNCTPEPEMISFFTMEEETDREIKALTETVNGMGIQRGCEHDNLTAIVADMMEDSAYQYGPGHAVRKSVAAMASGIRRMFTSKRSALSGFFLMSALFMVQGQTAEWLVPPQYSSIEYFAPGLYRVTKDGKTGVVSGKGDTKVKVAYDEIKPFREGLAVFGDFTTDGFLLKGVMSESGETAYASQPFYLLNEFPFYSEGFITVRDDSGKYGFLDEKCRPAFPFSGDEVRPFCEGIASVGDGDNFHYLSTIGEKIYLVLPNGEYPYGGTNYNEGCAYLWDQDGELFHLEADGVIRRQGSVDDRPIMVDYLYREDSSEGDRISYADYVPRFEKVWSPSESDRLWTYKNSEGKLLTPFQYEEVKEFSEGAAIASMEGKWGLLQIVEDNSTFFTKSDQKTYVYSPGKDCQCRMILSIPDKWKNRNVAISLKDKATDSLIDIVRLDEGSFSFSYKPSEKAASEDKTFTVEVRSNDMPIWKGEEMLSFIQRVKLSSAIKVNNADANADDLCYVTATVKNPSSIPVTTTVTLSGGGSKATFGNKTLTVTIPPYGSKSVTSAFRIKKVELDAWCAVTTGDGSSARRSNLELKPF